MSTEQKNIDRKISDKGVVTLIFDQQGSSANVFNAETLKELDEHLDWVAEQKNVTGLVLTSAKESIFVAGADLEALRSASGEDLRKFVSLGQDVFKKLADLKIPSVAAIHGACMGGGLEVALACDWRTASSDDATKIGLPETQLGILPAWGGSTRLPKLIGLPKALNLILAGKRLAPKHALKLGVVDSVVHQEHLMKDAESLLSRGRRKKHAPFWLNNPVTAKVVRYVSERKVQNKTHGNYPAQEEALEVVCAASHSSVDDSLRREREAVERLAKTEAAKNLIRVFLLQQKAKKRSHDQSTEPKPAEFGQVAVIGAGVMGSGIAQWVSSRNKPVILQDINHEQVGKGMKSVDKAYAAGVKRRLFSEREAQRLKDLIVPAADPLPLTDADVIIEAATEKLDLKKKIFRDLAARARPDALLATNTSALPVGELAADSGIENPERILGIHFFNPVHRMKLVEIVVAGNTAPEYVEGALKFVQKIGKLPVVVKDSPGFLVNRILMPYLIEAGRLYDQNADPEVIDGAMVQFGMPMGPLRLLDEVGLDVALDVSETIEKAFEGRFKVPEGLKKMVEKGNLGKKSGRGFYRHGKKKEEAIDTSAELQLTDETVVDLLTGLMIDEAARCLEEKVVESPEDVDFAMIMGTGWAPFRGGPLRYADSVGVKQVHERFLKAQESVGAKYPPSGRLTEMAEKNESFYANQS